MCFQVSILTNVSTIYFSTEKCYSKWILPTLLMIWSVLDLITNPPSSYIAIATHALPQWTIDCLSWHTMVAQQQFWNCSNSTSFLPMNADVMSAWLTTVFLGFIMDAWFHGSASLNPGIDSHQKSLKITIRCSTSVRVRLKNLQLPFIQVCMATGSGWEHLLMSALPLCIANI